MKLYNNYSNVDSLKLHIKEIESCLERMNYLAALHLSLSIPDILGGLTYPDLRRRKSYVKWFDEHVKDVSFGILHSKIKFAEGCPKMSGEICYSLRNDLFHEGTDELDDLNFNEFVLSFDSSDFFIGRLSGSSFGEDDRVENKYFYVSCKELCIDIIESAKDFIAKNPDLKYPTIRVNKHGGKVNNFIYKY